MPTPVVGVYPELSRAFKVGGWGDIQRPLPDKTDSVPDFVPAGNFIFGMAAAAGGVTGLEARFFGGLYNLRRLEGWRHLFANPGEFGNNPENTTDIDAGHALYNQGTLGVRHGPEF
jgi:hypothetical protein